MTKRGGGGRAHSFDDLAMGLDTGAITRGKAMKIGGAALIASALSVFGQGRLRPTRSPRRAGLGVGAIKKVVTSAGIEARDPLVRSVVARAVVVAGRAAVMKGATVAAQGRGAGMMEGASSRGSLLGSLCS